MPAMPARSTLTSRALRAIHPEPCAYVCPSCLSKQGVRRTGLAAKPATPIAQPVRHYGIIHKPASLPRAGQNHKAKTFNAHRNASNGSVASLTAINAPTATPPHLRDLHQQLQLLQERASSYVDLSRLQLALRSLESDDPTLRIAFLGLGSSGLKAARKLARVLLADELSDEEEWESVLLDADYGKSVLLKYGEPSEARGVQGSSSPLVRELSVPSARLKRWNVEILLTDLNASGYTLSDSLQSVKELEESILVPPVTMPNSSAGRVGFVRYPVHKALIVAEGVNGIVEYGRLPAVLAAGNLISAALSLPLRVQTREVVQRGPHHEEQAHTDVISIGLAENALSSFRTSNANGAVYSEQWQESRVSAVSDWLAVSLRTPAGKDGLKPAVEKLLLSILKRTMNAVSRAESAAKTSSTSLTISEAKRKAIQSTITKWSEEAHRDLQVNLAASLLSPSWRRTVWWRLFWRVDEVSFSAGDVLRRGWLVEAEHNLAFVSGRILEAGLAKSEELKGEPMTSLPGQQLGENGLFLNPVMKKEVDVYKASRLASAKPDKITTVAELWQVPPMLARVKDESGLDALFDPPWPQTIHIARQQKLHQLVPSMHRKAQALLLASLSTMGGSGALAGWLWVASGGVALYEAGAIAAFGIVWSLRRLQKHWSKERIDFAEANMEDGRTLLNHVEGRLRRLVQDGGRVPIGDEDRREWADAREAVNSCEEARIRAVKDNSSQ